MAVGELTDGDRRWLALADELAPAKSLQRLDTAASRVASTVSVVATVLTGLGLLAASLTTLPDPSRWLAVTAAALAIAALLVALAAQWVTVTRDLKPNDLAEVERWFNTQFSRRVRLARWAAGLLVASVACAGLAAGVSLLLGPRAAPTLGVTRTADAVAVDVTFRGVRPGQVATATVSVDGHEAARAAFGPAPDGTATRTLTLTGVPPGAAVTITSQAPGSTCGATAAPGGAPSVTCAGS
ncbi:hypothetical protein ACQPX6_00240 [Actinomycetospora sp. CA-101289]|uniref:hypothetical protein n=1 Tax=Actinomycetospora sp. CA-101289 TaxID=3239893 RepID=UPI003D9898B6